MARLAAVCGLAGLGFLTAFTLWPAAGHRGAVLSLFLGLLAVLYGAQARLLCRWAWVGISLGLLVVAAWAAAFVATLLWLQDLLG